MKHKYLVGTIAIFFLQLLLYLLLFLLQKSRLSLMPVFLIFFFLFTAVLCLETEALTHQNPNMRDYLKTIRLLPLQFLLFLICDALLIWLMPERMLLCGFVSLGSLFAGMVFVYAVGSARTIFFHK